MRFVMGVATVGLMLMLLGLLVILNPLLFLIKPVSR